MGFWLMGAPVLRLECFNPAILKTETLPVTCAQSIWSLSFPLIRAAFSRGSGFVRWHDSDLSPCLYPVDIRF
jgi:hypothetical protein